MAVYLHITEPERMERTLSYAIETEVTIGRASGCDIRIDHDPVVSRYHAGLYLFSESVFIKDLGSRNGICVNGIRFDGVVNPRLVKPRALRDGDVVTMGKTVLRVAFVLDREVVDTSTPWGLRYQSMPSLPVEAISTGGFTPGDTTDTAMFPPVSPD